MIFEISDSVARQFAGGIFVDEIKKYISAHADEYRLFLEKSDLLTSKSEKNGSVK